MEFPDSWFEDEVREGFYVSSLMKRAWAAQGEVLEAVQMICDRHKIRYFADWGTLLGAIRHGGRIPWDDDIDLCMLREDYDRFRAVANEELPEGCMLMDYTWSDEFDHTVGRVINSRVHIVEGERLEKYHGFPYVEGIDIFWLDDLPLDEGEEEEYFELIRYLYALIHKIRQDRADGIPVNPEELEYYVQKAEKLSHMPLDRGKPVKQQLYALVEGAVASRYLDSGAKEVTNLPMWRNARGYRLPKACFSEGIRVPFENMEIVVPTGYEEILERKYGPGWMDPVRAGGAHDYPAYAKQQEFIKKENAGQLFEYEFSKEEMERVAQRQPKETLESKVKSFLPLFREAHGEIGRLLKTGVPDGVSELLGECQNVAIQLGTLIEEERGEGHATVSVLEKYCETIFQLHEKLLCNEAADAGELEVWEQRLAQSAAEHLKEKKEIVFVPYKESLWGAMESVWRAAEEEKEYSAVVIPAPYYYKDAFGRVKSETPHYETDYPPEVPVTFYEDYDFGRRHPDIIVIQCPWDEYNYALTLHPFFYAKNLKQYTEQLIYIPPFVMDEIGPEDDRAKEMLKAFCNMPGVVHADRVFVQSEQMKEVYVELLAEFAGENTRQMWEKKISGAGSPVYDVKGSVS